MWPVKSGFIFSSSLLLTILGKVPFECLPARGLFNSLCLLQERRKGAQGYILGGTLFIWAHLTQIPSTERTIFCLEIYLDKPPERGRSHAEWVRLWLPNAEVRLDSSLPLTLHIQFITHSVGFTFMIHPQTRSFSLLPTLPGCSSCPHLSPGPLQSHFSTSMIAPTVYSPHVLKAHS